MAIGKREPLDRVVRSLTEHIAFLRTRGWDEPAQLLEMAKLDLQLRIHNISERELRSLLVALGAPPRQRADQTLRQLLGRVIDTAASRRPAGRVEQAKIANVRRSKSARRQVR